MDDAVIVVGSVTHALRGKEILAAGGIRSYIEKVKRTPETGCGYGLYVPRETERAEELLRQSGLRVRGRLPHGQAMRP